MNGRVEMYVIGEMKCVRCSEGIHRMSIFSCEYLCASSFDYSNGIDISVFGGSL